MVTREEIDARIGKNFNDWKRRIEMLHIVLGLLLMEPLTIYEIRSFIRENLQSICSDSMGSIQSAIKKSLEKKLIFYEEKVEHGVNKKRYFINESGIKEFTNWVEKPMVAGKVKNMELSRLFFMDIVSKEKRIELIDAYLSSLKQEKVYLEKIADYIFNQENSQDSLDQERSILRNERDFQLETLRYGIEHNLFDINFFENLRTKITDEENRLNKGKTID